MLASQPTMTRLNQLFDKTTMKHLQQVNDTLVERFQEIDPMEIVIFDLDSTNKRLQRKAAELLDQIPQDVKETTPIFYREFSYKAASWIHERRVVVKMEKWDSSLFKVTK